MQMGIITVQEYLQVFTGHASILTSFSGISRMSLGKPISSSTVKWLPIRRKRRWLFSSFHFLSGHSSARSLLAFCPIDLGDDARLSCTFLLQSAFCNYICRYISAVLMSIASVLFSVNRNFTFAVVLAVIFGLGYGGFSVIDWAMATDVLPSNKDFAKDMGIWSLALVLPQVIASDLCA